MLLISGHLPSSKKHSRFRYLFSEKVYTITSRSSPPNGDPMAILSAVINALSCYYPDLVDIKNEEEFTLAENKAIRKVRTTQGLPLPQV